MNKYKLIEISRKNPCQFYTNFENKYKKILQEIIDSNLDISQEFFNVLAKSPNIGYLIFTGYIGNEYKTIELFAHSQIQKEKNKTISKELHKFLLKKFCVQVNNPKYKDGSVNNLNNTLYFGKTKGKSDIWYRDVDSESKLIENFILHCEGKEVTGIIRIFTTFSPCLSCNNKILRFLEENSNVSIEVSYFRVYNSFKRRR